MSIEGLAPSKHSIKGNDDGVDDRADDNDNDHENDDLHQRSTIWGEFLPTANWYDSQSSDSKHTCHIS